MKPYCLALIIIGSLILLILALCFIGAGILTHAMSFPKRFDAIETHQVDVDKGFITAEMETWESQPYQLTIHLEFQPNPIASDKYVIITHGYTWDREGSRKYAAVFRRLGFNVILYDLRSHGQNVRRDVTMGYRESKDLHEIIQDTYRRYGENIRLGLHGESLGAATSLQTLAYQDKLQFVVSDCAYSSLTSLCRYHCHRRHAATFLLPFCSLLLKLRHGYWLKDVDATKAVSGTTVPILIFHGKEDDFILPKEAEKILAALPKGLMHRLVLTDKANHAESYQVDPVAYEETIRQFLDDCQKG